MSALSKYTKFCIFAFSVGLTLLIVDAETSSDCGKGFPVEFASGCMGYDYTDSFREYRINPIIRMFEPLLRIQLIGFIVNLGFWSMIASIGYFNLKNILNKKFINVNIFVIPIIFTIYSISNNNVCSGFICFGDSGRGFPLTINSGETLLINYLFWLILVGIFIYGYRLFRGEKS